MPSHCFDFDCEYRNWFLSNAVLEYHRFTEYYEGLGKLTAKRTGFRWILMFEHFKYLIQTVAEFCRPLMTTSIAKDFRRCATGTQENFVCRGFLGGIPGIAIPGSDQDCRKVICRGPSKVWRHIAANSDEILSPIS